MLATNATFPGCTKSPERNGDGITKAGIIAHHRSDETPSCTPPTMLQTQFSFRGPLSLTKGSSNIAYRTREAVRSVHVRRL